MLKSFKIPLTIVYAVYLYAASWNFITFYLACLGGWMLLCAWLPFNKKSYQMSGVFKSVLWAVQAFVVLLFAAAVWTVTRKAVVVVPAAVKAVQPTEEIPPVQEAVPAEEPALYTPPIEPASSIIPLSTNPSTPGKDHLPAYSGIQHGDAIEIPPASASNQVETPLMPDPAYNQAEQDIKKRFDEQNMRDIQTVLSPAHVQMIQKQPPFIRTSLMFILLRKNMDTLNEQLKATALPAAKRQEMEAKLKQTQAVYQTIQSRNAAQNKHKAIHARLEELDKQPAKKINR